MSLMDEMDGRYGRLSFDWLPHALKTRQPNLPKTCLDQMWFGSAKRSYEKRASGSLGEAA